MRHKEKKPGFVESVDSHWHGMTWNTQQAKEFAKAKTGRCIVLIDGFAVDVTSYLGDHVGFQRVFQSLAC